MSEPRDTPYHSQLLQFERGMLEYALEITAGDRAWAAQILGIDEEFLASRIEAVGGVPHRPVSPTAPEAPAGSIELAVPPVVTLPPPLAAPPSLAATVTSGAVVLAFPSKEVPVNAEEDELTGIADVREDPVDEGDGKDPAPEDDFEDGGEEDASGDEEPTKRGRGRPPAKSPNPDWLTRKDVELLLGLPTQKVLQMRKEGQLKAVWDENAKSYLFDRKQVETMAKTKAQQRQAKWQDDR